MATPLNNFSEQIGKVEEHDNLGSQAPPSGEINEKKENEPKNDSSEPKDPMPNIDLNDRRSESSLQEHEQESIYLQSGQSTHPHFFFSHEWKVEDSWEDDNSCFASINEESMMIRYE